MPKRLNWFEGADEEPIPHQVASLLSNLECDVLSALGQDADGPPSIFEKPGTKLADAWKIVQAELAREAAETQPVALEALRDMAEEFRQFHPWRGLARDAD